MERPSQVIILTGDRDWRSEATASRVIHRYPNTVFVLGDCPTGLDRMARTICRRHGLPHLTLLAWWDELGKRAGMARNGDMIAAGLLIAEANQWPIRCIGFHPNIERSKGTRGCLLLAKKRGIETTLVRR